jgi:mannose-6-phosphate isomerase-like protein (cupin superfamily)
MPELAERLNVTQQLVPGVTITILSYSDDLMTSRLGFEADKLAPLHHHREDEVNICLSGEFDCEVDGVITRLKTGDMVHVRGDQVHSLRSIGQPGTIMSIWGPVRHDLLKLFVLGTGPKNLEG